MNPLLVAGFGTSINVDRRRLVIENRLEKTRLEFFPYQIPYDSIVIDGNYGVVSFEAMRWLMSHKINLSLLNWNGNLMSVTLPREPISGKLKIMQYKAYMNQEKRQKIAKTIIKEKVCQSFNLLKELSRYYPEINVNELESSFTREERFFSGTSNDICSIMTYEGRIADMYWGCLFTVFNHLYPEFNFKRRNNTLNSHNRNASDEINALLNYGYSVMDSEVRRTANSIGLDIAIGFLHEVKDGRYSLVCDLQELYRWLVDLSVIQLLEEKKLKKKDFIVTENFHIRLREKTARMLIEKIRLNFNNKAAYKGENFSYENILYDHVEILANYILGKRDKLEFDIPLIKIARNDDKLQREKILSITPAERKKLGINKSTLWYQQKYIREGRKIKLYRKTGVLLDRQH